MPGRTLVRFILNFHTKIKKCTKVFHQTSASFFFFTRRQKHLTNKQVWESVAALPWPGLHVFLHSGTITLCLRYNENQSGPCPAVTAHDATVIIRKSPCEQELPCLLLRLMSQVLNSVCYLAIWKSPIISGDMPSSLKRCHLSLSFYSYFGRLMIAKLAKSTSVINLSLKRTTTLKSIA